MSDEKRCCPTDAPPAKCHYTPQGTGMYVTGPLNAKAGILLIGDIFGMTDQTKRTADDMAKEGYLVVMPDYFGAEAVTEADMTADKSGPKWTAFFKLMMSMELHQPKTEAALAFLRKMGCAKVAAVGLCWGSILTMKMSAEKKIDVAIAVHPARLTAEAVAEVTTPLCILSAVDDDDMTSVQAAMDVLKVSPKFFKRYTAARHGFLGARFDFNTATEKEKEERADAFGHLVKFCKETLA